MVTSTEELREHLFLLKCTSVLLPCALCFFLANSKVFYRKKSCCNIAILLGTLVVTYDVACVMMLIHLFSSFTLALLRLQV